MDFDHKTITFFLDGRGTSKYFKILQNTSKCFKILQNTSKYFKMLQIASKRSIWGYPLTFSNVVLSTVRLVTTTSICIGLHTTERAKEDLRVHATLGFSMHLGF